MKYYDFIELKTLKLNKNIDMNSEDLKLPVTLTSKDIEEIEYEPSKLSQKVFSFSLFFKYKDDGNFNVTYIYGLIYNYRLFLKFHDEKFKDYKFRVYIDKQSLFKNPYYLFYLSYLKKLEIELMKSKEINYEFLEIILCDFINSKENTILVTTLRFLPVFEGCECHCRDLDFRLSSYDVELIKVFDESKFPFYFGSYVQINPFLAGFWGGNINNSFKIRKNANFNLHSLIFFTVKGFMALLKVYSNLFVSEWGFDEFILRVYVNLLSESFIENVLIFGALRTSFMMPYMKKKFICANKNGNFRAGKNIAIYGLQILHPLTKLFYGFLMQMPIFDFKRYVIPNYSEIEQYHYLEILENGFIRDIAHTDQFSLLLPPEHEYLYDLNLTKETVDKITSEYSKYKFIRNSNGQFLENEVYPYLKKCVEFLKIDLYSFMTLNVIHDKHFMTLFDYGKEFVHPYFCKYYKDNAINRITELCKIPIIDYSDVSCLQYVLIDKIKELSSTDNIEIVSIPIDSVIKLKDSSIIFDKNLTIEKQEDKMKLFDVWSYATYGLKCTDIVTKTNHLEFIYFSKSHIVFTFIFNAKKIEEYTENKDNLCAFGLSYVDDLIQRDVCKYYTINDLKFYDKDGKEFNPLEVKGGNYYYKKYIKYKNKYLTLKNSYGILKS